MSEFQKAIELKERIVYELAVALGIDPDNEDIDQIEIPDNEDIDQMETPESLTIAPIPFTQNSRYNIYVAFKRNYEILKNMKESLKNDQ